MYVHCRWQLEFMNQLSWSGPIVCLSIIMVPESWTTGDGVKVHGFMGQCCVQITAEKTCSLRRKKLFLCFLFFFFFFLFFPFFKQIPHVLPRNLTLHGDIIHTGCAPYYPVYQLTDASDFWFIHTQNAEYTEYYGVQNTLKVYTEIAGHKTEPV